DPRRGIDLHVGRSFKRSETRSVDLHLVVSSEKMRLLEVPAGIRVCLIGCSAIRIYDNDCGIRHGRSARVRHCANDISVHGLSCRVTARPKDQQYEKQHLNKSNCPHTVPPTNASTVPRKTGTILVE